MTPKLSACALGLLAAIVASPAPAEEPLMRPGLWEITAKTEGMMDMAGQTFVTRQCLKPEDVEQPENFTPEMVMPDMTCEKGDFSQAGNTMRWRVACTGPEMNMEGDGTFTSTGHDSSEGVVNMKMTMKNMPDVPGMAIETKTIYSARRIGDC